MKAEDYEQVIEELEERLEDLTIESRTIRARLTAELNAAREIAEKNGVKAWVYDQIANASWSSFEIGKNTIYSWEVGAFDPDETLGEAVLREYIEDGFPHPQEAQGCDNPPPQNGDSRQTPTGSRRQDQTGISESHMAHNLGMKDWTPGSSETGT